jgi:outer membrane immunogenic protein
VKTLLAASVVVSAIGLASAAAAPVPMFDWTGSYVGVEGGGAWGSSTHNFSNGIINGTHDPFGLSGGLVGGTIGYNWQVGSMIAGLEGDLSWASSSGSTLGTPTACTGGPCTSKLTWLGTVRGRIGYAVGKWMPYVTGGLAFGHVDACENVTCSSDTHTGWTIGGGIEAKLTANWSAKAEFLYVDLGSASAYTLAAFPTFPHTEITTQNILRVGLNYKF